MHDCESLRFDSATGMAVVHGLLGSGAIVRGMDGHIHTGAGQFSSDPSSQASTRTGKKRRWSRGERGGLRCLRFRGHVASSRRSDPGRQPDTLR